jgi:hypothetical protein
MLQQTLKKMQNYKDPNAIKEEEQDDEDLAQ